jgi:hypothetical protein
MRPIVVNTARRKFNPFVPQAGTQPQIHVPNYEEAVIVDVVVNEQHPEYAADGYNVGTTKVRFLKSNTFRPDEELNWAFPSDANVSEYPLVDEIVVVYYHLDRLYYSRKINTTNRPTTSAFETLNIELQPAIERTKRLNQLVQSIIKPKSPPAPHKKTKFLDLKHVFRLRHWEGDMILEGRSGHSIRFGTAWTGDKFFPSTADQSPNLLLRVGPDASSAPIKASKYGVVVEDINKDKSSIWMVSNQTVELEYATKDSAVHGKSVPDFPTELANNQILVNTDRLVFNTKQGKILAHASDGIHWTTLKDVSIDANGSYYSWIEADRKIHVRGNNFQNVERSYRRWIGDVYEIGVKGRGTINVNDIFSVESRTRLSLVAPKIFVGSRNNTAQPIPLGKELTAFLTEMIDACLQAAGTFVMTGMGPGALNPGVAAKLGKLKSELASGRIISVDNFVNKTNDAAAATPTIMKLHS